MDTALWSGAEKGDAGMWPILLSADGAAARLVPEGAPEVQELHAKDLRINQRLAGGGSLSLVCSESKLTCTGVDRQGQPLRWAWNLVGGKGQKSAVRAVTSKSIDYQFGGTEYRLKVPAGSGRCEQLANGDIRLVGSDSGKLVLVLGPNQRGQVAPAGN
jgi:hypothetical protein